MICPAELANDLSACRAAVVGDDAKHGCLHEGRGGAGDAGAGSDSTDDGKADHVVAGGGDHWDQRPFDAAVAGALRAAWLRRSARPAAWGAERQAGTASPGGAGVGALSGAVLRLERAALSREAGRRAWDRTELYLGQTGAARRGIGGQGAQARRASQATATAAGAGDAAAYRRQPAPV